MSEAARRRAHEGREAWESHREWQGRRLKSPEFHRPQVYFGEYLYERERGREGGLMEGLKEAAAEVGIARAPA